MDSTYMIYITLIACTVLFLVIYSLLEKKRSRQAMLKKIDADWGNEPNREYTFEQYEKISHYFENYYKNERNFYLDDITWNDLDMDRIFCQINQTYSSVGEEYLYYLLRVPCFDQNVLEERNRLLLFFKENESTRKQIQEIFGRIGRTNRISLSDYIHQFEDLDRKNPVRYVIRQMILLASLGGMFIRPEVSVFLLIASIAYNVVTYYKDKAKIEVYFQSFIYIMRLLDGADCISALKVEQLQPYVSRIKANKDQFHAFRKRSYLLKMSNTMSGGIGDVIMDYVRMLFHVDLQQFNRMLKELKKHPGELDGLYEDLGFLESMIASASYRELLNTYCIPEFWSDLDQKRGLLAKNIYHPLIEQPIDNTIEEAKSVLLTGSNASGKSTFLKTMAINAVLAQTIYTVAGSRFQNSFVRVFTSMALQDSLETQESYYMVEIKSLKRILDADGEIPILCFVDEVLRGTNTVERIAASSEILKSLFGKNMQCFAATHDIELTHILEDKYANYHFQEEVFDQEIKFDYKLKSGRATSRNAIKLLQILGYPDEIIENAQVSAQIFIEEGIWREWSATV